MNWPSDVFVLRVIESFDGTATQSWLAKWALRSAPPGTSERTAVEHMSRSLQRLEGDGLITRKRAPADRRVWEYQAT